MEGQPRVLLSDIEYLGTGNSVLWPRRDRILFSQGKGGSIESDLWMLTLDSKGKAAGKPVRLTNTVGIHIGQTSTSANGERIAVMFERNSYAIFLASLNKAGDKLENPVRLTHDTWENFPDFWTPDSQTLFYHSRREDKQGTYQRSMSSESAELFLAGDKNYSMWGISADGLWYIVTANRLIPGKRQLLRVPVSGGTPELILKPEGDAVVHCATGRSRICVLSELIGNQMVFTEIDPLRGRLGELARINNPPPTEAILDWSLSPDGSKIAAVKEAADKVQVLDLRSKEVAVIGPVPPLGKLQRVAWSADGTKFVLTGYPDGERFFLVTMDSGGRTRVLLEGKNWLGYPRPSPDGRRIAYLQSVSESNVTLLEHF